MKRGSRSLAVARSLSQTEPAFTPSLKRLRREQPNILDLGPVLMHVVAFGSLDDIKALRLVSRMISEAVDAVRAPFAISSTCKLDIEAAEFVGFLRSLGFRREAFRKALRKAFFFVDTSGVKLLSDMSPSVWNSFGNITIRVFTNRLKFTSQFVDEIQKYKYDVLITAQEWLSCHINILRSILSGAQNIHLLLTAGYPMVLDLLRENGDKIRRVKVRTAEVSGVILKFIEKLTKRNNRKCNKLRVELLTAPTQIFLTDCFDQISTDEASLRLVPLIDLFQDVDINRDKPRLDFFRIFPNIQSVILSGRKSPFDINILAEGNVDLSQYLTGIAFWITPGSIGNLQLNPTALDKVKNCSHVVFRLKGDFAREPEIDFDFLLQFPKLHDVSFQCLEFTYNVELRLSKQVAAGKRLTAIGHCVVNRSRGGSAIIRSYICGSGAGNKTGSIFFGIINVDHKS